ncbi:MAG TPA: ABC transporter ATP-binding protein [Haloplasmataceae bacterium]
MELRLREIKKSFGTKDVLKGCTFTFEQGNIYGLLGRNGAGKTTLFNCLSNEIAMDQGEATLIVDGVEGPLSSDDISYVLSEPVLPDFLTGYEFIKFIMDIHAERIATDRTVEDFLQLVKISPDDWHRLIKTYSHGMKNKLQMLIFLITRPPVILLDEPLTSFDIVIAQEIKQLLRQIKTEHIIILSTHILELAVNLCDEIVILHDGVLSPIDKTMLASPSFEQELIERLKDSDEAVDRR